MLFSDDEMLPDTTHSVCTAKHWRHPTDVGWISLFTPRVQRLLHAYATVFPSRALVRERMEAIATINHRLDVIKAVRDDFTAKE